MHLWSSIVETGLLPMRTELLSFASLAQSTPAGSAEITASPAFLDTITEYAECNLPEELQECQGKQGVPLYDSEWRDAEGETSKDSPAPLEEDVEENIWTVPIILPENPIRKPLLLSVPVPSVSFMAAPRSHGTYFESEAFSDELSSAALKKSSGATGIPESTNENNQELVFGADIKKLSALPEEIDSTLTKQSPISPRTSPIAPNTTFDEAPEKSSDSSGKAEVDAQPTPRNSPAFGVTVPAIENPSGTPVRATNTSGNSSNQPVQVVSDVIAPPADIQTPSTMQNVSIDVHGPTDERLRLHVADTEVGIKVAVTGGRTEMAEQIRGGLHDLVQALEDRGFAADVWQPDRVASPEKSAGSDIADDHHRERGDSHPQQHDGRRNSNQQHRRWQEEMEIITGERVSTW